MNHWMRATRWLWAGVAAVALLAWAGPARAQVVDWRVNLTCPDEYKVREGVQYCTGQDEKLQLVHVLVVDLASPTVRLEYVLPKGYYDIYDADGNIIRSNSTPEPCRDPNRPEYGGPAGGCRVAGESGQYPRITLEQAIGRAGEVHQDLPLAAVINADYGSPSGNHGPEGLMVVQEERLDGAAKCDDDYNAALRPWLAVGESVNPVTGLIPVEINRLEQDGSPVAGWIYTGIGGGPMLVDREPDYIYSDSKSCGGAKTLDTLDPISACNLNWKAKTPPLVEYYDYDPVQDTGSCRSAPHTAAGISADRRWLFFAISTGNDTPDVLAKFLHDQLDVEQALKFDGGGSSQLWVPAQSGGSFTVPGDGRSLTNYLAIYAPPGDGIDVAPPIVPPPPVGDDWWGRLWSGIEQRLAGAWAGIEQQVSDWWAKVQADVARQFNEWWQSAQEELARTGETEINRLLGQLCGAAGLPAVVAGSLALARRRRWKSGG